MSPKGLRDEFGVYDSETQRWTYTDPRMVDTVPSAENPEPTTEICRRFQSGKCGWGSRCWYAHVRTESPSRGKSYPTKRGRRSGKRVQKARSSAQPEDEQDSEEEDLP